jgi:tetratricopeptide (TPR) repeat protein
MIQWLKTDKRKSAKAWFIKGCWYDSDPSQIDNAIAAYRESIKIDNTFVDAYVNLGFVYLRKEEYEEALLCFQRVAELETGKPETYNNLGYVYEKMERFGSAKQMYERTL